MNLFIKWFLKQSRKNEPEYTKNYYRSADLEKHKYETHPYDQRLKKWGRTPLEPPEEDENA